MKVSSTIYSTNPYNHWIKITHKRSINARYFDCIEIVWKPGVLDIIFFPILILQSLVTNLVSPFLNYLEKILKNSNNCILELTGKLISILNLFIFIVTYLLVQVIIFTIKLPLAALCTFILTPIIYILDRHYSNQFDEYLEDLEKYIIIAGWNLYETDITIIPITNTESQRQLKSIHPLQQFYQILILDSSNGQEDTEINLLKDNKYELKVSGN